MPQEKKSQEWSDEPAIEEMWVWAKIEKYGNDTYVVLADGPSDRQFTCFIYEVDSRTSKRILD